MLNITRLCLFIFFSILGSTLLLGQVKTIAGKLIAVSDGDTFTLLTADNVQYKIRLNGIDCPEKGQDFSKKAKNYTFQFCQGKTVVAEILSKDKYGRSIANVSVNGISLNQSLVAEGLAWHFVKYSSDATLAQLEISARRKKLNIWSLANPMAPWVYRHRGELQMLSPLAQSNVYVCQSKSSKTYHKKMCSGLSKCTKGIKQVSNYEAQRMGKRECGYCY